MCCTAGVRPDPTLLRTVRRALLPGVVALGLLLAACGDGGGSDEPEVEGVVADFDLSRDHVETAVDYPEVPPTGGPHAPIWLDCGFYDEPVPDELAVHALEHGAVWLAHDPDLSEDQLDTLRALFDLAPGRMVVSPYPGLGSEVVALAWGRRLAAEGVEDPRLIQFVERYVDAPEAPEPRAACVGGIGG